MKNGQWLMVDGKWQRGNELPHAGPRDFDREANCYLNFARTSALLSYFVNLPAVLQRCRRVNTACKLFLAPLFLLTQRVVKASCKNADVRPPSPRLWRTGRKRRSRDFGASVSLRRACSMLIQRRPSRLTSAPNLRVQNSGVTCRCYDPRTYSSRVG